MKKKTKKNVGLALIIVPIVGLPIILSAYAILAFVGNSLMVSSGGGVGFRVMNIILSMLGLVCVAGLIVGIPIGIVLLIQSGEKETESK